MSAGSRRLARVCSTNATDIGDDAWTGAQVSRRAGKGRMQGAGRVSKSCRQSLMLPTAARPAGAQAAVSGSSVKRQSSAPSGTCGPEPST
ncbi:hypothetical protein D3C87_1586740 [compost metagenome]